ncbi:TetR/AcrR family transcriptional regulator [Nocardia speluncae]|uniref:TetR/AcrR family transcriptional regulator n=1 Tax=Nocardia speluncae TaxID=419477 RepID=A0A846X9J9_9NOCA|nr:TetR/AcrR family transcriptional regulator [Nocardia speluncae]NKY31689.1 TetR/AcrR family transcriptional regulator [Nocardia speluncae]
MTGPEISGQSYGGVPFSDRQRSRRERLLDAALHLLDTAGAPGVTVRGVCREAGLNNRYFYENFADLDALLDAVVDRLEQSIGRRVAEILASGEPSPADDAIAVMVSAFIDDPRLLRILHTAGDPALARRREALLLRSVAALRPFLVAAAAEFGRADPRMLDTAGFLLVGGWSDALWAFSAGELTVDRSELVEQLTALFTGVARTIAR